MLTTLIVIVSLVAVGYLFSRLFVWNKNNNERLAKAQEEFYEAPVPASKGRHLATEGSDV